MPRDEIVIQLWPKGDTIEATAFSSVDGLRCIAVAVSPTRFGALVCVLRRLTRSVEDILAAEVTARVDSILATHAG